MKMSMIYQHFVLYASIGPVLVFFCNLLIYSFDFFVVDKVQCLSVPIAGLISLETK